MHERRRRAIAVRVLCNSLSLPLSLSRTVSQAALEFFGLLFEAVMAGKLYVCGGFDGPPLKILQFSFEAFEKKPAAGAGQLNLVERYDPEAGWRHSGAVTDLPAV